MVGASRGLFVVGALRGLFEAREEFWGAARAEVFEQLGRSESRELRQEARGGGIRCWRAESGAFAASGECGACAAGGFERGGAQRDVATQRAPDAVGQRRPCSGARALG